MTRVVKSGTVISDGKFLDLFYGARVINGNGGVITKRMQKEHLLLAKAFHGAVDKLNHAQHAMLGLKRYADDGPCLPFGHLVNAFGKALIVINVRNNQ